MRSCCVLFAKNPEPGLVKTRLQSHLSAEAAARLYRAFVLDCAAILQATRAEAKVVAYAPAAAGDAMRDLLAASGDFTYLAQPDGDLGERMELSMRWAFDRGAERVVIIGSDSPSLPPRYVDRGLELLREKDVVVGPSTDGGYYMVGRRRGESRVFADIEWSTGSVLEQTLQRLGPQSLGLLPPWYDVDNPAEAGFLKVHLEAQARAGAPAGRNSLAVLRTLSLPDPS